MALEYHLMMQDENKTSYSLLKFVLQQIPYIGNHPRKNKFADFAKFGSFANVFLLLFSVCQ